MNEHYIPWGNSAGMLVSFEDMKHRPLSKCRAEMAWINQDNDLACLSWNLGNYVLIPHSKYMELCQKEQDKETAVEQVLKLYDITLK